MVHQIFASEYFELTLQFEAIGGASVDRNRSASMEVRSQRAKCAVKALNYSVYAVLVAIYAFVVYALLTMTVEDALRFVGVYIAILNALLIMAALVLICSVLLL